MVKKYFCLIMGILVVMLSVLFVSDLRVEASEVSTRYELVDRLSEQQKQQIIKEQPNVSITHDKETFVLVYKNSAIKQPLTKTESKLNLKNLAEEGNKGTNYPKTGSKENVTFFFVGAIILVSTIFLLIWKRKKLKQLGIILIISTSVGYMSSSYAETNNLPNPVYQEMLKGNASYTTDITVSGYDYVGYIHLYSDSEVPVKNENGQLSVNYLDSFGQPISDILVLTGNIGTAFDIEKKTIDGYELKETKGLLHGLYQKEPQEVTFIYDKLNEDIEKGNVIFKIQDEEGTELAQDIVITGTVGEKYKQNPVDLSEKRYKLKEVKGMLEGIFTKEIQETILIYEKEAIIEEGAISFTIEKLIEKEDEEVTIISEDENGFPIFTSYPVLYYVWDKNDLTEKVDSKTITGSIGSTVTIPAPYKGLIDRFENGEQLLMIYPVYNDGTGEKTVQYSNYFLTFQGYSELSGTLVPDVYSSGNRIVPIYLDKIMPA